MINDVRQAQVMQQLGRTYRALLSSFDAHIGQPLPRWRVLLMLYNTGEMSQKKLANDLLMDPAALTRQIKNIEGLGWVRRYNDAADNRLTNVVLTPKGRHVVEQTAPRRTAFMKEAFIDLPPADMEALSQLLDTLETRLRTGMSNAAAQGR